MEAATCFLAKPSLLGASAEQRARTIGAAIRCRSSAYGASGKTEQSKRVVAADLLSIELADLAIVKPARGIFKALEWIIDGVQNTVTANFQHCREE